MKKTNAQSKSRQAVGVNNTTRGGRKSPASGVLRPDTAQPGDKSKSAQSKSAQSKSAQSKSAKPKAAPPETASPQSLTLGDFARQTIAEQYQQMIQQEQAVLDDLDPEHLHQMRVGTRRLRTALQVFDRVVELPKAASARRLRQLAKTLGKVRDLDVQLATLSEDYQPHLSTAEQGRLETAIAALRDRRAKSLDKLKAALSESRYRKLKQAYEDWLAQPQYQPIAEMPLETTLAELLTPLLSELLLHRAWLIPAEVAAQENSVWLHDLRKLCKHVRYEAEFFMPFYDKPFQKWVKEVKKLQSQLGDFQDAQVLRELLTALADLDKLPDLRQAIAQAQDDALADWDKLRQKYLSSEFRHHLHQLMMQPASEI